MRNLKYLQTFITLAETQSFTRTANKHHLTTMAISKQIKNLESEIGEQLFIRSTRKVSLTEFAERFYQQCKNLHQTWLELESFIQHHKVEPQGTLRLCISISFGKSLLMNKLRKFHEQFPKIDLDITLSEEPRIAEFQQGKFDILFGFPELPGITENLKYRKLYTTKNMLCASKEFIEDYGMPKTAEDLIHYKFINHSLRKPSNIITLNDGSTILTSKPQIIFNSFSALMDACLDGCGIFLTGDLLAQSYIDNGQLISILPDLNYRLFQLYVFYRPMNYEQPNIRAFIDFYSSLLFDLKSPHNV